MDEGKFKRELDHYLAASPPEYEFCNREWGICPDSVDEATGFPGEPHICMWPAGHSDDHVCGTCEEKHPLSPSETSMLEERHHAQ